MTFESEFCVWFRALNSYCQTTNGNKKNEILSNFLQNLQEDIVHFILSASKARKSPEEGGDWEDREYEYKNKVQILQEKIDLARERVKDLDRELKETMSKSRPKVDKSEVENLKWLFSIDSGKPSKRRKASSRQDLRQLRRWNES